MEGPALDKVHPENYAAKARAWHAAAERAQQLQDSLARGASPTLAIIVPYRNRPDHLFTFLPWMRRYFADRTNISFHIIEQAGDAPFNRGKLCNAGYLLVRDQIGVRDQTGGVCFHDVDFLPINVDYPYPVRPARLVLPERMITSTLGYHENQDAFFGAVVAFNNRGFEKINGFPNVYSGWGPEDRELGMRCQLSGLGFDRRDGEFRCLPPCWNERGWRL